MKNISNSVVSPFNFEVTNNLTVGNDVEVEDTITTNTINSTTINTSTLDAAAIAALAVNTPVINFGISPFTYSTGTFTPTSRTLESDGPNFNLINWHDSSGQSGSGRYVKCGNLVTVYYQCTVNFGGVLNDFIHTLRIPVISNLPFTCAANGTDLLQSNIISEVSFPNGYVLGIAAPLTITMDGSFVATIYEQGTTFIGKLAPLYVTGPSWVSDGRTAIITCSQSQYTLGGLSLFSGIQGPAYNFNVITTGTYTSGFKGSLTYFTNE